MLRMVAWLSLRPRRIPVRAPFTSVMPPLSMATSVPVPMAMPPSACARAGALLMPSAAIAAILSCPCALRRTGIFCLIPRCLYWQDMSGSFGEERDVCLYLKLQRESKRLTGVRSLVPDSPPAAEVHLEAEIPAVSPLLVAVYLR